MKRSKKSQQEQINKNNNDPVELTTSLNENIHIIKNIFKNDGTFIMRIYQNKFLHSARACICYLDGLVNTELINENIIQPFLLNDLTKHLSDENLLSDIQSKILLSNDVIGLTDMDEITSKILGGDTAFFLEGFNKALIIQSKISQSRAIDEPGSEMVIRGPREGFVEPIMINLSLIRQILRSTDLKFVFKRMGTRSNTNICVCYLEELADPKIIKEVHNRLDKISIDGVLDSGYVQELIKDAPYSPFETIGYTERPDVVAGGLLEGRIAIIVDGSPVVLTMPYLFIEYFQSNEDYYNNYYFSTINRVLRIMGVLLTISIPGIYVALVTFHKEMIPTTLLMSIAVSRKGVPFPTVIEAVAMLLAFELFVETSRRMPKSMGTAVSLVGTLFLGQAAVDARFVSSPMVIVVGLTGITGLIVSKLKAPNIVIRFILLFLSAFLGLYGYLFGMIGLLLHLCSMSSFGIPYMMDIGSFKFQEMKDTIIRAPWWNMKDRPKRIVRDNYIRSKGFKNKGEKE